MLVVAGRRAFAKVIDFGIAKALGSTDGKDAVYRIQRIRRHTCLHVAGTGRGNSGYRYPHGRLFWAHLLYELLTGSPPFDARELRSAAYEEMRRIIR